MHLNISRHKLIMVYLLRNQAITNSQVRMNDAQNVSGLYFLLTHIHYLFRFQKTFYKVPHQRLLLKLKADGIGDGIIDWIEQWLTEI